MELHSKSFKNKGLLKHTQIILHISYPERPIPDIVFSSGVIRSTNRYTNGYTIFDVIDEHRFMLMAMKHEINYEIV